MAQTRPKPENEVSGKAEKQTTPDLVLGSGRVARWNISTPSAE
jgi:hypothetical protein